jgi:hypothetical protein
MFTFGIFTTHFPYLAFVAFYACFLLFGVNKASSGEIQIGESYYKAEIYASKTYSGSVDETYHFNKINAAAFRYADFESSLLQQRVVFPVFRKSEYRQKCSCSTHFARPPPTA